MHVEKRNISWKNKQFKFAKKCVRHAKESKKRRKKEQTFTKFLAT
jgi:hypothetical protein